MVIFGGEATDGALPSGSAAPLGRDGFKRLAAVTAPSELHRSLKVSLMVVNKEKMVFVFIQMQSTLSIAILGPALVVIQKSIVHFTPFRF